MKNKLLSFFSFFFLALSLCSCKNVSHLTFSQDEYEVKSGDIIKTTNHVKGVTYSFIDNNISGLSVESNTGLITFSSDVNNYSQVLYQATYKNEVSLPVVLTLIHDYEIPELTLINPTSFVSDGDYIVVNNSLDLSNTFTLKNKMSGVSIDPSSGKLNIDDFVLDNTEICVVITSNGAVLEHNFYVAKNNIAKPKTINQSFERSAKNPISYYLDFSNVDLTNYKEEILMVFNKNKIIDPSLYSYDNSYHKITFSSEALSDLTSGENILTIATNRNNIKVNLVIADKFIKTAEDLVNISSNQETLRGYYILTNDIDLTSYLSIGGDGYNDGKGWNPIGIYHDVADGTSLNDVFNGTFDGDGYTIKGLYINRGDDLAYNAGLFGYVGSLGVIKNLNVETSDKTNNVKSYAGVICGFNSGLISNCTAKGNISNYTGEGVYKYLGGIAGRNAGEITSCISYVDVNGDNSYGLIVGFNEGIIDKTYSFELKENISLVGSGISPTNSILFSSLSDLLNYSYFELDSNYWDIRSGEYPSLKHQFEYYFIDLIMITNVIRDYTVGDIIKIEFIISPQSLMDKYKDNVTLEVNDSSLIVDGLNIDTSSFLKSSFIATIKLNIDNELYHSSLQFFVHPLPNKISINEESIKNIIPGEQYVLSSNIDGDATANYVVNYYTIPSIVNGVSINDNLLMVDGNISTSLSFELYAKVGSVTSDPISIIINPLMKIDNNIIVKYNDENNDINIDISYLDNVDEIIFNHSKIDYTYSSNCINLTDLNLVVDEFLELKIISNHIGYLYYVGKNSENKTDISSLTEYIEINDKDDLKNYFNISSYSENKYSNYNKTFVLTSDIDFENETIYGIGTEEHPFTGRFIGLGHTIKNFNINDNEDYFTLSTSEKSNKYRKSKYSVGFFSYLSGEVRDLNLSSFKVYANNYVGGFAGTINENAEIRNVHLYSLDVRNINEVDHPLSSEDKVHYFAAVNLGRSVLISANGGLMNLY
ncbi:MAG: hypothetical protein SO206_02775 [Bacilli bacterium]|nr:hypothetical protein [Bacilli bacterium]